MSETSIEEQLETSKTSIQAHEDSPAIFSIYEWNKDHWRKMLDGHKEDDVMKLNPFDPRFLYDPLTWKFRTDPAHAWSIPTGNRTPNREALKALRKAMEESGQLPPRRHRHRHHHNTGEESEAARKERQARKRNLKNASETVTATPMQMALQARQSHVNFGGPSLDLTLTKPGSKVDDDTRKEKLTKKSKKSTRSVHSVSLVSSLTTGLSVPVPLQIIEVTFYSIALHWYDMTAIPDEEDEDKIPEEEELERVDADSEFDEESGHQAKPIRTITFEEASHRATQQAEILGDSRPVYILESKEQNADYAKDWKPISVGYGRVYVHDNLRSRTTYLYRVRSMDHKSGNCSAWSEILEVTTHRPPYTLQDVLLRINSNDIQGIVEILETGEVNPNAEDSIGFSPLMRAAQHNKPKLMQALIRNGADPNFQSKDQKRSAIMVACYSGNLQAVKTLRLFDASYDQYDSSHLSAVHWTVDSGNMELMEYILADGANIECVDNQGWTPLHRTALVGARTEGICEVLIRYGAKMDRLDKDLKTPLMNATISNKGQIAQILISRGADVFVANKEGRTAYDLACALERKGTMMILEDLIKSQKKEISALHGQGLKGGTAKIDHAEFENLDSFARQLAIKMRKKPSIIDH